MRQRNFNDRRQTREQSRRIPQPPNRRPPRRRQLQAILVQTTPRNLSAPRLRLPSLEHPRSRACVGIFGWACTLWSKDPVFRNLQTSGQNRRLPEHQHSLPRRGLHLWLLPRRQLHQMLPRINHSNLQRHTLNLQTPRKNWPLPKHHPRLRRRGLHLRLLPWRQLHQMLSRRQ